MYVVFVLMYVVTCVINFEYGYLSNLKIIVWMTLQFGMLYLCDIGKDKSVMQKELKNLLYIIIAGTTLMNFIGVIKNHVVKHKNELHDFLHVR